MALAREIKGFYQSSLGKEVDFRDIMNVSPNILAKKKTETWFCRLRCKIETTSKVSLKLPSRINLEMRGAR